MNLGVLHPFSFYDDPRKANDSYETALLTFVLNGNPTVRKIDSKTGASSALSGSSMTYEVNGNSFTRTRYTYSMNPSDSFIIEVNDNGTKYYDGTFTFKEPSCGVQISGSSDCDDNYFAWETDSANPEFTNFISAQFDIPEFKTSNIIRVSDVEEEKLDSLREIKQLKFVGPKGYFSLLQGYKVFKTIKVDQEEVINWDVSQEEFDEGHATITISFQYPEPDASSCCEVVNIDDVIADGQSNLTVTIDDTSNNLTANVSGTDTTNLVYSWYKNGNLYGTSQSVQPNGPGEYTIEVRNQGGQAQSSTSKTNECEGIIIQLSQTGNDINANILNAPSGHSVSVKKDGTEVATSLPYTVTESGVFYVFVTGQDCEKSAAIDAVFESGAVFTLSLEKQGNKLVSATDASSPIYNWERESANGAIEVIGSGPEVALTDSGIYWLTVTEQGTEKKVYYLHDAGQSIEVVGSNPYRLIDHFKGVSGSSLTAVQIDLTKVNNPTIQLEVFRNKEMLQYNAAGPQDVDEYGISGNDYIFHPAFPLENEDFTAKLN